MAAGEATSAATAYPNSIALALPPMSRVRTSERGSKYRLWSAFQGRPGPYRQQTPYCCHSRNHGLCASISSCLRFAAERSFSFSGLPSGIPKIRSSHSISAMVCSLSISLPICTTIKSGLKYRLMPHAWILFVGVSQIVPVNAGAIQKEAARDLGETGIKSVIRCPWTAESAALERVAAATSWRLVAGGGFEPPTFGL